ncbi:hypothetical protein E3N88_20742 [Mikania micrantha]|uniref:Uncharacterized protein n=1 Tax=Mikania micrantha TaxID=192012 RepID=A0A5N6NJ36_9ASTR|nr:hypothetical protein E3N88_20742 [Mikania micrantha]
MCRSEGEWNRYVGWDTDLGWDLKVRPWGKGWPGDRWTGYGHTGIMVWVIFVSTWWEMFCYADRLKVLFTVGVGGSCCGYQIIIDGPHPPFCWGNESCNGVHCMNSYFLLDVKLLFQVWDAVTIACKLRIAYNRGGFGCAGGGLYSCPVKLMCVLVIFFYGLGWMQGSVPSQPEACWRHLPGCYVSLCCGVTGTVLVRGALWPVIYGCFVACYGSDHVVDLCPAILHLANPPTGADLILSRLLMCESRCAADMGHINIRESLQWGLRHAARFNWAECWLMGVVWIGSFDGIGIGCPWRPCASPMDLGACLLFWVYKDGS